MLFHTWTFAAFFLVAWPIWLLVCRTRLAVGWLVLASYVFAAWANPLNVLLMLDATLVDYLASQGMARTRWRRSWLALSVANNLALLGCFKYSAAIAAGANAALAGLGLAYAIPSPHTPALLVGGLNWLLAPWDLPFSDSAAALWNVNVSFFVFRSLSYTIDCFRRKTEREPSLLRYAAFVAFFPELLAGPIDRATTLLPQMRTRARPGLADVAEGASLILVGLFKKVALADYLARYLDPVFAAPQSFHAPALLLATFAFTWQIYFDFSGYTDMARGVGRLLGYRLAVNFNHPYLAVGLGDFWHRWHISLSTWFRDYVYIPLGGSRHGPVRTYLNVGATMVLSGVWHGSLMRGSMLAFIVWGSLHALGWIATSLLEPTAAWRRTSVLVRQLATFAFVWLAWIFFRAESVSDALVILRRIAGFQWADPQFPLLALVLVAAVWIYQYASESKARRLLELAPVRIGLVVAMVLWLAVVSGGQSQPFIYQQF